MVDIIKPEWPAPESVRAYSTTRIGGYSEGPYESLNLANHVGDDPENVTTNRQMLQEALDLAQEPLWLEQVHGDKIICADAPPMDLHADGAFARTANKVCVVLTADCLPILLTNTKGNIVCALHVGWRGLAAGIIEKGIALCQKRSEEPLLAWLGPAIAQESYEVGAEVRDTFIKQDAEAESAFVTGEGDRWHADLYQLARQRLTKHGVKEIYGGDLNTFTDEKHFYSYRRDGAKTGRMATMIWLTPVYE